MAARVISVRRLTDLQTDIETLMREGALDQTLSQAFLRGFEYNVPSGLPRAEFVIVLAHPEPLARAEFSLAGQTSTVVVQLSHRRARIEPEFDRLLADTLEMQGFHTAPANLPLKALAVRSGLGQYGRDNLCYIRGMGSLFRLAAFYTDAPLQEQSWGDMSAMDACATCAACMSHCPAGSIASDRFLIRAVRCWTYIKEMGRNLPARIDPAWHNALICCMRCQAACPQNLTQLGSLSICARFEEDETAAVLAASSLDQLPVKLRHKLAQLGWDSSTHAAMRRNLAEFTRSLDKERNRAGRR